MGILLWAMFIFLGYQLFFGNRNTGPVKTADELRTELANANQKILDHTIVRVFGEYEKALNNDKNLSQEEKDALWLKAQVIVADTQVKAAVQRRELSRVIPPADTFINLQKRFQDKPIWNEKVKVAQHRDFPQTEYTPAEMKERVRQVASELGKNTPVWGFFPGYELMDSLVAATGRVPGFSYALACLFLAIALRIIIFPLTHKQMMWGRQMSQLAPLANEIRAKYGPKDGKPATMEQNALLQQKLMDLYKEYGFNPMSGCAPMLAQLPLFFMIYQSMLHYRFEFEKGVFLWINPSTAAGGNGFFGANLGQRDYLLIIIYAITMVVSTLLMPVSDPTNARQGRVMGVTMSLVFGIMMFFWPVPSAFILYWVFLNILATAQSLWTYRLPLKPLEKKNTVLGGVYPTSGGTVNGVAPNDGPRKTGVPQRHRPKKKK